jgi:hypothetical protein
MLGKIEAGLIAAIRHGQPFDRYSHAYCPGTRQVTLHGHVVAELDGPCGPGWWATCGGWNTARTRQLINALSRHLVGRSILFCHGTMLEVDGVQIDRHTWFPIQAGERKPALGGLIVERVGASRGPMMRP